MSGRAEVERGLLQSLAHLGGGPVGVPRPEDGGEGGALRSRCRCAAEWAVAQRRREWNGSDQVRLGTARVRTAGAVGTTAPLVIHGADGDHFGAVTRKRNATGRDGVLQTAAESREMKIAGGS